MLEKQAAALNLGLAVGEIGDIRRAVENTLRAGDVVSWSAGFIVKTPSRQSRFSPPVPRPLGGFSG